MDLREIGINTRNWVDSAQDKDYWRALVNVVSNLRVPWAMELVNNNKSMAYNSRESYIFQIDFCNRLEDGRATG